MEEKPFVWTSDLIKKLLNLRYENDALFKKNKQPWSEFYKIMEGHGFPEEMTVNHVRKKWSYMYDTYKIAKKEKNKSWKYYKTFEKIFATTAVLDKYESWNDEWRLKLITCITEAKTLKLDYNDMWRAVERAMRCQDLPVDCCIQDMKGLWHYIRTTFNRKHRLAFNRKRRLEYVRKHRLRVKRYVDVTAWPLYGTMLSYYKKLDPEYLARLETVTPADFSIRERKSSCNYFKREKQEDENEFHWTKDITESFIQIRLQNDWIFRDRKWAWNDMVAIMIDEYGFPKTLTGREISRKWATTFSEYQKAKATNNKSWMYYNLFELYLGEGSFSLNPIIGWQEEWISNLITARMDFEHVFKYFFKDQTQGWKEVEKRLRSNGLPLDHSLLELPEVWAHMLKTFKWKKKFSDKGILTEEWPYYKAMAQYEQIRIREELNTRVPRQKKERVYDDTHNDTFNDALNDEDYEDDMKLFDLKQKLELKVKPKFETLEVNQCRSCGNEEGCIEIFNQMDVDGVSLAEKLRIVGGIEVTPADNFPSQICLHCLKELESAYKFRRRCQELDKDYRNRPYTIKIEVSGEDMNNINLDNAKDEPDRTDINDLDTHYDIFDDDECKVLVKEEPKARPLIKRKRKKLRRTKYEYLKICEVCGKHTKNLLSHLDMHSNGKFYSCDVCDKKFKFKSGLIIHKAVHDPTPKKTCEVCGKTFHILAQYRRHFVYHANERKFECDTCGKRFNTLDILRVHNRTHTDERPFSCPECGKTFRTAGCVSRHKRIVHRSAKVQSLDQ